MSIKKQKTKPGESKTNIVKISSKTAENKLKNTIYNDLTKTEDYFTEQSQKLLNLGVSKKYVNTLNLLLHAIDHTKNSFC